MAPLSFVFHDVSQLLFLSHYRNYLIFHSFVSLHIKSCVPYLLQAIEEKDWSAFCDLTVADSNEMHAVCLDTFPPCVYMTDTSHAVASLMHQYNDLKTTQGNTNHKVNLKRAVLKWSLCNEYEKNVL